MLSVVIFKGRRTLVAALFQAQNKTQRQGGMAHVCSTRPWSKQKLRQVVLAQQGQKLSSNALSESEKEACWAVSFLSLSVWVEAGCSLAMDAVALMGQAEDDPK